MQAGEYEVIIPAFLQAYPGCVGGGVGFKWLVHNLWMALHLFIVVLFGFVCCCFLGVGGWAGQQPDALQVLGKILIRFFYVLYWVFTRLHVLVYILGWMK